MHLALGKKKVKLPLPSGSGSGKIKAKPRQLFAACSRVSDLCNVFPVSLSLLISGVFEQGNEELPFSAGGTCSWDQSPVSGGSCRQQSLLFCKLLWWGGICLCGVGWLQEKPAQMPWEGMEGEKHFYLAPCREHLITSFESNHN